MQSRSQESAPPTLPVTTSDLEIYRQKYENFRHFDRLRWQMPGIALAIGAGVVALSARQGVPHTLIVVVLVLLAGGIGACAYAMRRIRARLEENRLALTEVAVRLGDYRIARPGAASAMGVLERFMWAVAISAILVALAIIADMWGFDWL